jgi:RND superfamily putative drug exporter
MLLTQLGTFAARKHWWFIGAWVLLAVVLGSWAAVDHGKQRDGFSVPGTQSQAALDLLAERFPSANGTSANVVFIARSGNLDAPSATAAINQTVENLGKLPDASFASSPFAGANVLAVTQGPDGQSVVKAVTKPLAINADRTVAYSQVNFSVSEADVEKTLFKQIQQAAQPAVNAGLRVEYGGAVVDAQNPPTSRISNNSESIGILFAVAILLVALGTVVAMLVPIIVALGALKLITDPLIAILSNHFTINSVAPVLGSMLALGVGIDYSLFILSRYRQQRREGAGVHAAVGQAVGTSGSAVLFAAICVCIAMFGLYFVGIPYVTNLGFVAALFVGITALAALTLLPAILGALGDRIEKGRIHRRDLDHSTKETLSHKWADETSRHPWRFSILAVLILVLLALPAFSMRLGFTDDGDASPSLTQRRAFDVLTKEFGAGINGPLVIAIRLPQITPDNEAAIVAAGGNLYNAILETPGVVNASLPIPNNVQNLEESSAVIISVTSSYAPNDRRSADLVRTLRTSVIPKALTGSAIPPSDVYVGGQTAILIDLTAKVSEKLWLFIGAVVLGAFLLLMIVFRSLVIPLNAAIMNLLSIGGAYGVIVVVFQWGWGKGLIGLDNVVPVIAFVPVMMFAVLFGLSMDYEVFLLTRIKEEYDKTGKNRESVVEGLAATARVITAAALIMIAVFLSFVPNPDPTVKMIGLGMAVAVLIDATIVRMVLVPSTMQLTGRANWWLPRWLDRVLPHINVEGSSRTRPAAESADPHVPTP